MNLIKNDENSKNFGLDFIELISSYPLGCLSKSDYECIIAGLLEKNHLIEGNSHNIAVSLQTSVTVAKNLKLRFHSRFEKDDYKNNAVNVIKNIFSKDKNKQLDYENGVFSFIVDDPVQREDFRVYMEEKGYITDTSFNNNIVKVKAIVMLDLLKENSDEKFYSLCNEISNNSTIQKELIQNIKQQRFREFRSKIAPDVIKTIGDIIFNILLK